MKLLANLDLEYESPRYATAMMKAMLASPACFCEQGFSTMFAPGDFSKLCYGGKSRPNAVNANVLMNNASSFITAYTQDLSKVEEMKLINELEVRLVMLVGNKKTETRKGYESQLDIAVAFYSEASRNLEEERRSSVAEVAVDRWC